MTGVSQKSTNTKPTVHPPEYYAADRGYILINVGICFLVLEIVAFILRAIACKIRRLPLAWSDALMTFAVVSNNAMIGLAMGKCPNNSLTNISNLTGM